MGKRRDNGGKDGDRDARQFRDDFKRRTDRTSGTGGADQRTTRKVQQGPTRGTGSLQSHRVLICAHILYTTVWFTRVT